jgi:hypothetical protein
MSYWTLSPVNQVELRTQFGSKIRQVIPNGLAITCTNPNGYLNKKIKLKKKENNGAALVIVRG